MKKLADELSDSLKDKKCFGEQIYKDEPIIKPASSLNNRSEDKTSAAKKAPDKIDELYDMMRKPSYLRMSEGKLFYIAGKLMENYTYDYDKDAPFFRYYPTYREMNRNQLRTYFTWRTNVRKGIIKETSLSYAYVYIYELINLIGVKSAEEAFLALKYFILEYSVYDERITQYYIPWCIDFAVYYSLPSAYLKGIYPGVKDESIAVLMGCKEKTDEELFTAILEMSSYDISKSAFYKTEPELCASAAVGVYRAWAEYCDKHRKVSLSERLFGIKFRCRYTFFENAVFYGNVKHTDCEYSVSSLYKFICTGGKWYCERYQISDKKNTELGSVIRETDRILRQETGYKKPLKPNLDNKTLKGIIEKTVRKLLEEKREAEKRVVKIDVSSLDKIRRDADVTRDKLITEEERVTDIPEPTFEASPAEACETSDTSPLDSREKEFLRLMLTDGDIRSFAKNENIMLSMIADSVNEKLFDNFGDTVIEFDDDIPRIVEDYREELKEIAAL